MNLLDAAYHTVHDYPGGPDALAQRLGKHATTLRHEVRPPAGSTAKLGLQTARTIMEFSGDHRILHALATEMGQFCIPLPALPEGNEGSADELSRLAREFSDVVGAVATAMADGRVTDNELRMLERQSGELVAAVQRMLRHFSQLNAASKPIALRTVA